jgi:hypothetical protein
MITHILELDARAEAHTDPYRSPPAMYGSDQRIYCSWPLLLRLSSREREGKKGTFFSLRSWLSALSYGETIQN